MQEQENNLIAEIEFWRELIASQDTHCGEAGLERMQQALALAERKLRLLAGERNTTGATSGTRH